MRKRPLPIGALCGLVVVLLCTARTAWAAPIYDCARTATVYDPVANVVVTATGSAACTVYDDSTLSFGGHLGAAAPLGSTNITTTSYDSAGRLTSDTGGFASTVTYDSSGRLATDSNPQGTEQYFYDSLNRLMSESGPASITQTTYDSLGRLTSLTDSHGTTLFTYDAQGRLMDAGTTTFAYDALGRLMTETTPTDTTTYTYDALGRVTAVTDTLGNIIQFTYDPGTGLLDQVDTNGVLTTYIYTNGLLSGASDPGRTSLIYTAPIPEPSSLVILGSALLGLLGIVRKRANTRRSRAA